jgi:cyclophilin family peptidyl-prolyl cis-trans isomerase
MVNLRRTAWILAALVLVLAGCGGGDEGGTEEPATTAATTTTAANERPPLDQNKVYSIVFETNQGIFHVELDQEQSPNVSASMYALAKQGFFDGTICHRIVPGFVIQCGDPTGTGTGGPGYSTQDDVPSDARYTKGVVAMAKTQVEPPGTAGSQFFVVTGEDVGLPPEYAILGKVTEGLDVIEKIGMLGGPDEQPTEEVKIEKATATEAG